MYLVVIIFRNFKIFIIGKINVRIFFRLFRQFSRGNDRNKTQYKKLQKVKNEKKLIENFEINLFINSGGNTFAIMGWPLEN